MSTPVGFGLDVAAILILVFVLYFPRHRRKDLVVSYLGVNIGVLAVAEALTSADVNAIGLGFGLFGVLSIIRLRSFELDQQEVAYYFAALALGVLGGVPISPDWLAPALMGALLVAIFIGDHPRLFARYRVQIVTLDQAIPDEVQLIERLEQLLGGKVRGVAVRRLNLVEDTTVVEVRFQLPSSAAAAVERTVLNEGPAR
jgi:hypothetical protein